MTLDPRQVEADLVTYYDGEDDRIGREMDPHRVALRNRFLTSLTASSRVLELGSGPGRDTHAFLDAGHRYVALDLSFGHCQRFRAIHDAPIVRASVRTIPMPTASIDAVWKLFSRRSDERWRSMLAAVGTVEEFDSHAYNESDFRYQWAYVRRPR